MNVGKETFIKIEKFTRLVFTAMTNIVNSSSMPKINNLLSRIRRINRNFRWKKTLKGWRIAIWREVFSNFRVNPVIIETKTSILFRSLGYFFNLEIYCLITRTHTSTNFTFYKRYGIRWSSQMNTFIGFNHFLSSHISRAWKPLKSVRNRNRT